MTSQSRSPSAVLAKALDGILRRVLPSTPDFIIIGAQKSGTSSLFEALARHPQIVPPDQKELHYFDNGHIAYGNQRLYTNKFPSRIIRLAGKRTLEASPSYFYDGDAAVRIASLKKKPKLVLLLRDPVERAFSAWNMYRRLAESSNTWFRLLSDDRTFEEAVEDEKGRLSTTTWQADKRAYLKRGLYFEQLKPYLRFFGIGVDLHVIFYEELFFQKEGLSALLRDLGLDVDNPPELRKIGVGENKSSLSETTRQDLRSLFAPHNERLEKFLGRPLPWDWS
jgi:hypothetical protein